MDEPTLTTAGPADLSGANGMSDEVSRIRDIIFGANMRDYERRFAQLESHLLQELTSLRTDMISRFDAAAAASSAEFGRLHERVTNEVQQLNARVSNEVQQLNARLQDERDARNASVQDLHDALQRARDAADERASELQSLLEHRASELREGKTDRHQLGDLLRQLGDSLQAPADSRG